MSDSTPRRRTVLRRVLIALGILGILAIILAIPLANVAANSDAVRGRIARGLTDRLGYETTIGRVVLSPLGNLRVEEMQVVGHTSEGPVPLASVGSVVLRPEWSTILEDTISISRVDLQEPNLTVIRLLSGQMLAPIPASNFQIVRRQPRLAKAKTKDKPKIESPRAAESIPEVTPTVEPPPAETPAPPIAKAKPRPAKPAITQPPPEVVPEEDEARGILIPELGKKIGIHQFRLKGGFAGFLNEGGQWPILTIDGYRVALNGLDSKEPAGNISIDSINILGLPIARDARMNLKVLDGGHAHLNNLRADLLGGELAGQLDIDGLFPGIPYQAKLRAIGLTTPWLERLPIALLGGITLKDTPVDLVLDLSGFAQVPNSIKGLILLRAKDIEIDDPETLAQLRKNWKVGAFEEALVIDSFAATIQVGNGMAQIDDLTIKTTHGILRSRGFLFPNGEIRMNAKAYVTPEVAQFLHMAHRATPMPLRPAFAPLRHTSWLTRTRDITIAGNIRSPLADIWIPGALTSIPDLVKALTSPGSARLPARPIPLKPLPKPTTTVPIPDIDAADITPL